MTDFLKTFKTLKCPSTCNSPNCKFYHSAQDYRRKIITYAAYVCQEAIQKGFCIHENCKFCSNYTEFLYHPENYKNKLCIYSSLNLPCIHEATCPNFHPKKSNESSNVLPKNIRKRKNY